MTLVETRLTLALFIYYYIAAYIYVCFFVPSGNDRVNYKL